MNTDSTTQSTRMYKVLSSQEKEDIPIGGFTVMTFNGLVCS